MKLNQQGVAHVLIILVVVAVLGAIGFVGYAVYKGSQPKSAANLQERVGVEQINPLPQWKEGGIAISGTYADADVIQIDKKQWRMYYAIQPEVQGHTFQIYSAISTDGKNWTPEAGTRKTMATFPDVVKMKDGRYRMYFQQAGEIKSAISTDGLEFKDEAGVRIDKANAENLALDNVAAPSVAQMDDDTFVMVYRGTINTRYAANTPNPSTQLLFWATSDDGLTFTKKGIAADTRNETLAGQFDGPDLTKWDAESYKVFATSYTGVYEMTFDGKKFGEPTLAYAGEAKKTNMGFQGAPPGDPTTIQIHDTWYMYYGGPREKNGINFATLE